MYTNRLPLPPEGQTIEGWCLYEDDRWDGPCPQESNEHGWVVYRDKRAAFVGLAREMQSRCELFAAGQCTGEYLRCNWYPARVTLYADGRLYDEFNSEHYPEIDGF